MQPTLCVTAPLICIDLGTSGIEAAETDSPLSEVVSIRKVKCVQDVVSLRIACLWRWVGHV